MAPPSRHRPSRTSNQQQLQSERFARRLNRLYQHFLHHNDTAWGGADYLLLQRGEVDDDDDDESNKNVRRCRMNQLQSIALFRWLFGSSTTQQQPQGIMTVLLLRKDGSVWFLVHHADKEWMNALVRKIMPVGRSGPLTVYLLSYNRNDHHSILHGSDQLWKDSELLQSNHCQIKVATFLTEQERNLGATGIVVAIEHRLKQNEEWGRIQLVDAALGVALATAVKEEQEVYYMTQASALSAVLMKHGFQATMLDHLDDETSVSHIDLADYLEGIFNDPSRVSFRLPAGESYGSCYTPIIQSGGEYDLSLDAVNTDKLLTDDVVTVSLGASCEHYCSIIARTYLFNPSESVREIYNILLDMRDKCLTFMRPGQPIKTVYQAAVDLLAHKNGYEYLQDHLPENLGFGTGLVVQEISLCLSASNDTVFEDGMSFCVSFAFQNLREDRPFTSIQKAEPLLCALVVSDTVVVKDHGAIILTDMPCRLTDIAYEESESSMLEEDLYEGITTIADRMELLSTVKRQVPIADHMVLESTVKRVYEAVEKEREAAEYQQLQEFLCTKRDKVVEEWRAKELIKKRSVCSVLAPRQPHLDSAGISPSSTGSARKRPKFSVRYHRTKSVVASVCSIPISASPLPTHATYVPVRRSHWADDSKELAFVPGLGDDAGDIGELLSMHDTTHRENLIAYGAECQQEQMNDKIDKVLRRVLVEMTAASSGDRGAPISPSAQDVVDKVANIMGESIERIQSRYENLSTKQGNRETEGTETWISSGDNLDDRFRKVVDSCRELWCRRCHIYDCDLHGSREKPSFAAQLVHGLRAERTRCREIPVFSDSTETCDDDKFSHIAELSAFHKSICKQMYSIFEGDVAKMSCVMRAPVRLIQGYIDSQKITGLPASAISCPISKSDLPYHSVKNYRNTWYNRYRDAEIYPFFYPCYHDEKCTDDNCTCIQNRFFCTKACGWGNASPNFFRGCDCKGRCIQTNCTCFGAKRECDPNLCKCTGCTDPPGQSAVKQRCRNDNIVMQRERPLLLGRSEISGWGLFTKRSLKPGDFVGEYTGEAISQEEAERRGQIADAKDCSYLFMVASDLVLDASRKGNKTRFMNHSETPNVEPRTVFVQGEQRISFYAMRDIPEQSELFFNYNYKCSRDNDLVLQTPATNVKWMKINVNPMDDAKIVDKVAED